MRSCFPTSAVCFAAFEFRLRKRREALIEQIAHLPTATRGRRHFDAVKSLLQNASN